MKSARSTCRSVVVLIAAIACRGSREAGAVEPLAETTNSAIAIANLDQQIAQLRDEPEVVDLLLLRSRFFADYVALERASELAENQAVTGGRRELLMRAKARAAVHRFADALADLDTAARQGATAAEIAPLRASISVAIGKPEGVTSMLEVNARRHPGFASRSALAGAYAALGRLAEADRLYVEALDDLDTTLPFPYAWIYFARGIMWAEQGRENERARAAALYAQALAYLPEFAVANIHLAEIEVARGDTASAMMRLERVVQSSGDPEAVGLLGALHLRTGNASRGRREISQARARYESLVRRHLLAFADHASEFYLGPGADPERAWVLARANLANRQTGRAVALAIKAAKASGRAREADALAEQYP